MNKAAGIITIIFFVTSTSIKGQNVPEHFNHYAIYDFLDELANNRILNINSIIKPYSKKEISSLLFGADTLRAELNKRQVNDLDFYLRIYAFDSQINGNPYSEHTSLNIFKSSSDFSTCLNPLGLFYKNSDISMSLKPIWGIRYYFNSSGNIRHTWGGAEAYMTVNSKWGFYASLRENNMTDLLAPVKALVQNEGGNYKINAEGIDAVTYSEMRGGFTYDWNWGSVGLVKDHVQWGINYNGPNIFSGRTPSFPMIKLELSPARWFDFHYFHGWLVSEVVDSSRSYYTSNNDFRSVYRNKYIAANMFTFKIIKYFDFSFGNSIVYSDSNVEPAFLIPFLFYKSVDHTINHGIDNQNSQMFFALGSRIIKHTHLYGNIFIDDFSVTRISDKERHNFAGSKAGLRISDWPIKNVILTAEYTKTNPVVYKHRIETLSFESNKFNLGHYLRDNSRELFLMLNYKPFRGVNCSFSYLNAEHGNEYQYIDGLEAEKYPFIRNITWKNIQFEAGIQYEFISEAYLYLNYRHSNVQGYNADGKTGEYYLNYFTPEYLQGKKDTFIFGFNLGF
jgi:hypothetical protein